MSNPYKRKALTLASSFMLLGVSTSCTTQIQQEPVKAYKKNIAKLPIVDQLPAAKHPVVVKKPVIQRPSISVNPAPPRSPVLQAAPRPPKPTY